jgi:hypothetical protein
VRDEIAEYYPDGRKRLVKPVLTVDFGSYGPARAIAGEEGHPVRTFGGVELMATDVRGGFIDTDVMAQTQHWDADDKAAIEARLEEACTNPYAPGYGDITRYEHPKPVAPWPTYDEMDAERITEMATELGLSGQALFYEQMTLKREEVMDELTASIERAQELTAA